MSFLNDSNTILIKINEMINLKHNPNLIKIDEAPNGNVIYHIYSDGEITSEKGGGVYGQRSRFTQTHPISQTNHIRLSNYDIFKFPLTDDYNNKYAITTRDDAFAIRLLMIDYITKVTSEMKQ